MDEKIRISEAGAFLAGHPEIEIVDAFLSDLSGVLRGKQLGRHDLANQIDPGPKSCRAISARSTAPSYHATKPGEMERYDDAVPPLEYEWYLRSE